MLATAQRPMLAKLAHASVLLQKAPARPPGRANTLAHVDGTHLTALRDDAATGTSRP
jgi:hypothetical protein